MTYNVFSGTLNPTHFTSLHDLEDISTGGQGVVQVMCLFDTGMPGLAHILVLHLSQ